ncbi:hypothetical protein JYU34_022071 [Plutella xylostella]|uniref:Uncharacterized protein n=1 Tax=Plutella xylostella TaxID=51655 RepID=A0ABQ7PQF4_PLUXY|nr:hypothetical protein JYU34_022071 [Plutella xylostella]
MIMRKRYLNRKRQASVSNSASLAGRERHRSGVNSVSRCSGACGGRLRAASLPLGRRAPARRASSLARLDSFCGYPKASW